MLPRTIRGEEIKADLWQILVHSVKYGGLGIPDHQFSEESSYNTSNADSGELVDSRLGGSALNYVVHRAYVHQESVGARIERKHVKLAELARQKELAGGQERNRLHRATSKWSWLSAIPHRLKGTALSREESWDNLHLRYGMMPQDIPVTYDGCGKKFLFENALSCLNWGPCSGAAQLRCKGMGHPWRPGPHP